MQCGRPPELATAKSPGQIACTRPVHIALVNRAGESDDLGELPDA